MKTPLRFLIILLTVYVTSAQAALVTRTVNLSFVNSDLEVDIDNDGDKEFVIYHYADLPGIDDDPNCDYSTWYPLVYIKATANTGYSGTTTNDVSYVGSSTSMAQMQINYISYVPMKVRLGSYKEVNQTSGTCYPYTPYRDNISGFLYDTTHTTSTYFAFYANLNGSNHYGYMEFDGYHLTKIVYEDQPDTDIGVTTGVSASQDDDIMVEQDQNGNLNIIAKAPVYRVIVSDLNGRTEEYTSPGFRTQKKAG